MQNESFSHPSEVVELLRSAGLRPPRTLTIAITGACNLKCSHCWVDAGVGASAGHVPEEDLRRIVEEFADVGGEGVRFTGGEPLCHPRWRELLRFARAAGFARLGVQSNGMLFDVEAAGVLRDLDFPGLSLQVSLDGATEETHDRVRGRGAFNGVMAGLRTLAETGLAPRITLFFTEMRHNLEEIPDVLELADSLGVAAVVSGALVACGRAGHGGGVEPPEPAQYAHLLRRFDVDPRFRDLYRKFGTVAPLEWRKEGAAPAECCTFVENPYLTPRGVLYPCVLCHADPFAVTGVFGKGLTAVFAQGVALWASLQRVSERRAAALTPCQECPARLACAGGCMGRAWGSCGDLHAVDDRCEVRRLVHRLRNFDPSPPG